MVIKFSKIYTKNRRQLGSILKYFKLVTNWDNLLNNMRDLSMLIMDKHD